AQHDVSQYQYPKIDDAPVNARNERQDEAEGKKRDTDIFAIGLDGLCEGRLARLALGGFPGRGIGEPYTRQKQEDTKGHEPGRQLRMDLGEKAQRLIHAEEADDEGRKADDHRAPAPTLDLLRRHPGWPVPDEEMKGRAANGDDKDQPEHR